MAENTIQRVIQIDTSASEKTVRELTAEVEQARKKLAELQAGTESYAEAAQRAAEAEKQLNQAMDIAADSDARRMATMKELAETQARDAEAVNKLIDALVAYRDAGYDVSGSLGCVTTATQEATRTTMELDGSVVKLQESGAELIEAMVREQEELAAVQAQRKALNKEIAQGLITEERAVEIKSELIAQENIYKARVSDSRKALATMTKEVEAAEGSYNQMSQTLSRLKSMYRELSEEQRNSDVGADLIKQIQGLDSELKNLDASMGQYQRNVGNYGQAINKLIPGFSNLTQVVQGLSNGTMTFSGVAKGAVSALKGLTAQALAFIATPLGAAIMAIVVAYKALKSGIDDLNDTIANNVTLTQMQEKEETRATAWQIERQKANEETAKSWIKVKGAVYEAWEAYKTFYTYVYTLQWGKLWNVVTGVGETKEALANIEDWKKELHEMQVGNPDEGRLGTIEKISEIESEIAALRRDAADKENFSDEERQEFLQQAIQKNRELYAIKRQELLLQLKIAEAQHRASPDNAQFEREWANLRKMVKELDAQESNAERMLLRNSGMISKAIASAAENAAKEAAKAAAEAAREREKAAKEAAKATEKTMRDTLKIQQGLREDTFENELKTAKENYQQELADFNKTVKEKNISEEVAADYRKALAEKNEADIAAIRKKWIDKSFDEAEKAMKKEEAAIKATYKSADDDLQRDAARETAEAKRDITDPQQLEQELSNIQQRLYEKRVELIDQTLQGVSTSSDLFVELSNQRADLEIKNIERVAEEERKANEEKKKRAKLTQETTLNIATSTLNALSSILGEETAAGKAAAVAAAIIDTYKAANSAYASLASVPFVGPGLGAAAAAAAVVAGIANVKKIIATKEDGSNAASIAATPNIATPAVVTPPAVIEQVPLTRTLTSASEEERLNQMASPQRVYVVYDDIAQAGRNVQVQQAESTF